MRHEQPLEEMSAFHPIVLKGLGAEIGAAASLRRRGSCVPAYAGAAVAGMGITVAEAHVPVLREGRVVGHIAFQPEAAKPAIDEVDMDLLAQPPL